MRRISKRSLLDTHLPNQSLNLIHSFFRGHVLYVLWSVRALRLLLAADALSHQIYLRYAGRNNLRLVPATAAAIRSLEGETAVGAVHAIAFK